METDKIEQLRKDVKKLMIDTGHDRKGELQSLSGLLDINFNSLSMALTGYRNGKASEGYLLKLQKYLMELLYPEHKEQ